MATFTQKRGDTFELLCTLENEGNAVDITNFTITCQVRAADDTLLQDLTVTKTNAVGGVFALGATAAETEGWDVGQYVVFLGIPLAGRSDFIMTVV